MTDLLKLAEGPSLYDNTGRPIEMGDIIKVFHFVHYDGKRRYMYKQVVRETTLGKGSPYLVLSHLNMKDPEAGDGGYYEALDGRRLKDCEIVQSVDACFEDRPRIALRARAVSPDKGDLG